MKIKFGFDGSGSHAIYNQVNNQNTNNMILSVFCPLKIEDSAGESVWIQSSPNAPLTQRPVSLQMGKESVQSLQSLQLFNEDVTRLKEDGFDVLKAGQNYHVDVEIQSYMMDMKAAHLYLGTGGAYCDLCSLSKEQSLDLNQIDAGFFIDRSIESVLNIFEDLVQDDGTVLKQRNDYDRRSGVTTKPIPSKSHDVKSTQVLHALLRTFDHYMKCAVHVKAAVFTWTETTGSYNSQFLKNAKFEIQKVIVDKCGEKWDYPDQTGKGGTTTTGKTGRRILHNKAIRDLVVGKLPEQYIEIFSTFGQCLSVIIRVLSSKKHVNVEKYRNFCTELHKFLIKSFPRQTDCHLPGPWISITPSLHKVLCHSWELIEMNEECGLGSLDEAGLEGNNKILRAIRIKLSRKTSQIVNLRDTLNRMWVGSDPLVNKEREKALPYCKLCNEKGHSFRYCCKKKVQESVGTEDDKLFETLTS